MSVDGSAEPTDSAGAPYPPYVRTSEERRRWDLCVRNATATSELCEPSGIADHTFVWFTTRALYKSDIPTGDRPTRWTTRRTERMRTNLERLNGREIAAPALAGPGGRIAKRDFEAALVDALTNLRHFARLHDSTSTRRSGHRRQSAPTGPCDLGATSMSPAQRTAKPKKLLICSGFFKPYSGLEPETPSL